MDGAAIAAADELLFSVGDEFIRVASRAVHRTGRLDVYTPAAADARKSALLSSMPVRASTRGL